MHNVGEMVFKNRVYLIYILYSMLYRVLDIANPFRRLQPAKSPVTIVVAKKMKQL